MVRFTFHDDFPDTGAGWYAHYDHVAPPSGAWRECDVRRVIGTRQESWIDDLDAWHAALCQEGERRSDWWWTTAISRPNLWSQAQSIKPLFMAAAIREWALANPDAGMVHVIAVPPEVRTYLNEFLGEKAVAQPRGRPWRALGRGLRSYFAQFMLLRQHLFRRAPVRSAAVLFYSHLFFPTHGSGDHFFGAILDRTMALAPGAVQVAYYADGRTRLGPVRRQLAARDIRAWLLLDCLTLLDMVRTATQAFQLWFSLAGLAAVVPAIRIGAHQSQVFAYRYLAEQLCAKPPVMEIAVHHAFLRVVERARPRLVIYPYEQKGLERALLRACRAGGHGVRTIGYAHPAHTKAHLALRSRPSPRSTPPKPDLILTSGPLEQEFFETWGRTVDRVVSLGSHRYRPPIRPHRPAVERQGCLRILVITGHGFELSILANLVARRPDVFGSDQVQVRRTGSGWFEAQEAGIRRLTSLSDRITVGSGSLVDQIGWCDVALFSSTTAGVEAMLAGRVAVYVALHDIFEADPLLGETGVFARCTSDQELADALTRARALSDADHDRAVLSQIDLARRVLAPIDDDVLKGLIDGRIHPGARPEMSPTAAALVSHA